MLNISCFEILWYIASISGLNWPSILFAVNFLNSGSHLWFWWPLYFSPHAKIQKIKMCIFVLNMLLICTLFDLYYLDIIAFCDKISYGGHLGFWRPSWIFWKWVPTLNEIKCIFLPSCKVSCFSQKVHNFFTIFLY